MKLTLRPAWILLTFIAIGLWPAASAAGPSTGSRTLDGLGILVIAHGGTPAWNAPVKAVAEQLRSRVPAEAAFLMGTKDRTPQEAYERLVAAGARRIVVVPLLVSSHSAHAEQVKFIAGARPDYPHAEHMQLAQLRGPVPVVGAAGAMDDHPLIAAILADRARALSRNPGDESLVIVAHGPNEDAEAARWIDATRSLGSHVRSAVPFRDIDVRLLRDDAPKPVKEKALADLRAAVADRAKIGRVIVVPLLVSTGRVGDQIPGVLEGLAFAWDGRPLLPDSRVGEWILAQAQRVGQPPDAPPADPLRYEEQLVVTATRTEQRLADVPVRTEVIDRATIDETGSRSVADVLSRQLGAEIVPTLAGDGIQLQGIDARGILVLVDGQEVIGKIGGSVDLANLLVDDVERIEIVKGAGSAVYGSDALGGVINVLTRTAAQPIALSAEQRFESLDGRTSLVSAGGRNGRWSGLLSASRVSRDAYDLVPAEPTTTGSAYRKIGVNAKTSRRFGTATDLSVVSRYYDEEAADVTMSRGVIYDDRVLDDRWQGIAELRTKPASAGSLTVRGHLTRYTHDFERVTRATRAAAPDRTAERIGEFEAQYDHAVGMRHLLTVGTEYERSGMTSDRISPRRRDLDTAVGFIQDEWSAHDRVRLLAGVRFDNHSAFGSAWSPKLAVLVRGADAVRIRASYGEGFKAPEFKDLYYVYANRAAGYQVIGNADLRAETSRSLNGSVDVDLWNRKARLTVTGFRHAIADLIDSRFVGVDPASRLLTYQTANVGRARTYGVETDASVTPAPWVTFGIGYGWLDATDRATGEPLTLRARRSVKGRAIVRAGRLGLTGAIFGRYLGRRAFADTNRDGRIDDFSPALNLWDARVAKDLGRQVQVFLGADNLFAEQDVRYFPSPGRRVYAGASVRYSR